MEQPPRQFQFEEASVPHEDVPIPVEPFKGTPEEIERQWFEQLYLKRGAHMRQLTWRAVLMGCVLGAVLSLTNIYVGLKAGWGAGSLHHRLHFILCDLDRALPNRHWWQPDDHS